MALDKSKFMALEELAAELNIGHLRMQNELRRDYSREIPKYPFAIAMPPEGDGVQWTYRIYRDRYNRWKSGELGIDIDRFADAVAKCVVEKMGA